MKEVSYNGHTVRVVEMGEEAPYLTDSDKEMDARAQEAVTVSYTHLTLPTTPYV